MFFRLYSDQKEMQTIAILTSSNIIIYTTNTHWSSAVSNVIVHNVIFLTWNKRRKGSVCKVVKKGKQ
jgi:hypothetical protein